MSKFSVVIPTLQRSEHLPEVVARCSRHPMVGEILIINNAQESLTFDLPKVRVLNQEENIFVNPAWNLGAREAQFEYLAIVNDAVLFEDNAFELADKALRYNIFGIVGPDATCFRSPVEKPGIRLSRPSPTLDGFGTFMCLRTKNYTPIPSDLKIWGGDDLLILNQHRPPAVMIGTRFVTDMSTTSGSAEFQAIRKREHEKTVELAATIEFKRWWHRPFYAINDLRKYKDTLRKLIKRGK